MERFNEFERSTLKKLSDLRSAVDTMKKQIEVNSLKISQLENRENSRKLIFHGLLQDDFQNNPKLYKEELINYAITRINSYLSVGLTRQHILDCYSLGKKPRDPGQLNKNKRPIVIVFVHIWMRNNIFVNKRFFKTSNTVVYEFLSKHSHKLLSNARKIFKNNAYSFKGVLYVKLPDGSTVVIKSSADLNSINKTSDNGSTNNSSSSSQSDVILQTVE